MDVLAVAVRSSPFTGLMEGLVEARGVDAQRGGGGRVPPAGAEESHGGSHFEFADEFYAVRVLIWRAREDMVL